MPDELIPEDHYLRGREGHDEGRLARARLGLPDEVEETTEEAWEGLGVDPEEEHVDEEAVDQEDAEDEETSRGVVVRTAAEALGLWVDYQIQEGEPRTRRFGGLSHPSSRYGAAIGAQVVALVEGTEGFLFVERRLRGEYGLSPARDAYPEVYPSMPTALVLVALPLFLDALEAELPREFFPPRVVAGIEIERTVLEGEAESQAAIDAKWRAMYPRSWRRG